MLYYSTTEIIEPRLAKTFQQKNKSRPKISTETETEIFNQTIYLLRS